MVKESTIDVFIEIPKGDDRRRHLSYDKKEMLDLGPIKNVIPVNNGVMPVAYGFIIGTLQKDEAAKNSGETPDEIDVLVYSKRDFKVGEITKATPIALLTREDGDHKIVATDSSTIEQIREWSDIPQIERDLICEYMGYKSPINSIEGAKVAIGYIKRNRRL